MRLPTWSIIPTRTFADYVMAAKIELTILENRILLYFLKNRNKVINREELMMEVWGYNADVNTRTLDMHIVSVSAKK
jgi:two-component system alkaline phosphatase synthesis response regulator PhoP